MLVFTAKRKRKFNINCKFIWDQLSYNSKLGMMIGNVCTSANFRNVLTCIMKKENVDKPKKETGAYFSMLK